MSTYAIGDIQGCLAPLQQLLDTIHFAPDTDQLWLLGDLVNRGPDSLGVLRLAQSLGKAAVVILGNHDLHLLAVAEGLGKTNKNDTLSPILAAPDRDSLLHWLRQQHLLYYSQALQTVAVHAGIPPIWSLEDARRYAAEAEGLLRGRDYLHFLQVMYGNTPDTWQEDMAGDARVRLITNYLTRMRFCTAHGQLELSTKTGPDQAPKGHAPWFHYPNPSLAATRVIFGHWASLLGHTGRANIIGLDTGCVWGNRLTALCLESGEQCSVGCQK